MTWLTLPRVMEPITFEPAGLEPLVARRTKVSLSLIRGNLPVHIKWIGTTKFKCEGKIHVEFPMNKNNVCVLMSMFRYRAEILVYATDHEVSGMVRRTLSGDKMIGRCVR